MSGWRPGQVRRSIVGEPARRRAPLTTRKLSQLCVWRSPFSMADRANRHLVACRRAAYQHVRNGGVLSRPCRLRKVARTDPLVAEEWRASSGGRDPTSARRVCGGVSAVIRGRRSSRAEPAGADAPTARTDLLPRDRSTANSPLSRRSGPPTKNSTLTPRDVTPSSTKLAWWKCDKARDHVWEVTVAVRAQKVSKPGNHGGCTPFTCASRIA